MEILLVHFRGANHDSETATTPKTRERYRGEEKNKTRNDAYGRSRVWKKTLGKRNGCPYANIGGRPDKWVRPKMDRQAFVRSLSLGGKMGGKGVGEGGRHSRYVKWSPYSCMHTGEL
ncbi:hypothetical protein HPB48_005845 [Haemaphysalis longicornis]|uniref:Uncharacterized protein n=1 Tax=Haemaphysalis longicornis TaxID=44386 RepID=A0A9J6GMY5_HAELO|nr:hypothetical protein HPB48_005845 [Haemaphysalis longicornis]